MANVKGFKFESLSGEITRNYESIPKISLMEKAAIEAHLKLQDEDGLSYFNLFKAGVEWQKKQDIDKAVRWKKNSDENKPMVNHSVLIKSTYGIAEGEWDGEQWIQYRWLSKIKDCDVQYWMELSDLEK